MKYMGSKTRVRKEILPIILKDRKKAQWYVEPFVGGGNIIESVSGNRLGADANRYVIEALLSIRDNCDALPKHNKEFTEDDYRSLRSSDDYPFKGYAGFALSYGGKWLGGWRRDRAGKRDYVAEAYRSAVKQSRKLQGVRLMVASYEELDIPSRSIIYCDPPYQGTTSYATHFDHGRFWEWCLQQGKAGHTIFVSEYKAPPEFTCVWEKELVSSLTKDTGSKSGTERLFALV